MNSDLKNTYENLIQDMIIDGIDGMTVEIKNLIQNAPVEKRRSMILTILEENNVEHRLMCSKIQKTVNTDNYSEMNHIKDVVGMLREYVKVSKTQVKEFGEVMTPLDLTESVLDTLPYEVWSNPNLKWFDSCSGVGTFFSVVVERLMKGLSNFEPNEKLRYKHILENMIYSCELQAKNLFLFLYAFDPKDEYSLNIYNGSYLEEGFDNYMKTSWGVDKFDIIVQNPPYQELKEGNKKSQAIWDKFVVKAISQLVDGGYMCCIHPDSWRLPSGDFKYIQTLLKSKQMVYLEIHDKNDGFKTFGATTTYDFYCLHNVPNTMFTKIKCMDGTTQRVDISKMEFIPNGMYKEFENLIAKNNEDKVNILYSRSAYGNDKKHMSKIKMDIFIYPCVYYTYKDGTCRLYYSSTKDNGHFNIPKIIWSQGGASTPILDEDGEYGVMNFACSIIDEPKILKYIQKAMLSENFMKLMSYTDGTAGVGGQRYNNKVISLFKKDFWKFFI